MLLPRTSVVDICRKFPQLAYTLMVCLHLNIQNRIRSNKSTCFISYMYVCSLYLFIPSCRLFKIVVTKTTTVTTSLSYKKQDYGIVNTSSTGSTASSSYVGRCSSLWIVYTVTTTTVTTFPYSIATAADFVTTTISEETTVR